MTEHQKHTKLTKPNTGNYGRNEWAIMGTSCSIIQKLAQDLVKNILPQYKTAYVDADHKAGDAGEALAYSLQYTDKINFNRLDFQGKMTDFQQRSLFNEQDIILINGNHFQGKRQIVVLDSNKFESLSRKLDRLTHVDAFISLGVTASGALSLRGTKQPEGVEIPTFLKEKLNNCSEIPVFNLNETDKIADFLISNIAIPPINALILVGGKSTRMGHDKSQIDYHGKPQWQFMADLLRGLNLEVFISCREEQAAQYEGENLIIDSFTGLGPFGAIASAFRENPNTAWLVVACDLPLLNENTLKTLIDNRKPSAIATTYRSPAPPTPQRGERFPEPLITIWEPKSYAILLQFLAQGVSCPRKVLINSNAHIIDPSVPETLMNVNTPEEMILVKR